MIDNQPHGPCVGDTGTNPIWLPPKPERTHQCGDEEAFGIFAGIWADLFDAPFPSLGHELEFKTVPCCHATSRRL